MLFCGSAGVLAVDKHDALEGKPKGNTYAPLLSHWERTMQEVHHSDEFSKTGRAALIGG